MTGTAQIYFVYLFDRPACQTADNGSLGKQNQNDDRDRHGHADSHDQFPGLAPGGKPGIDFGDRHAEGLGGGRGREGKRIQQIVPGIHEVDQSHGDQARYGDGEQDMPEDLRQGSAIEDGRLFDLIRYLFDERDQDPYRKGCQRAGQYQADAGNAI